jgi:hypothetical protein
MLSNVLLETGPRLDEDTLSDELLETGPRLDEDTLSDELLDSEIVEELLKLWFEDELPPTSVSTSKGAVGSISRTVTNL